MILHGQLRQLIQEAEEYYNPNYGISLELFNQLEASSDPFEHGQLIADVFKLGMMQGIKMERGKK